MQLINKYKGAIKHISTEMGFCIWTEPKKEENLQFIYHLVRSFGWFQQKITSEQFIDTNKWIIINDSLMIITSSITFRRVRFFLFSENNVHSNPHLSAHILEWKIISDGRNIDIHRDIFEASFFSDAIEQLC